MTTSRFITTCLPFAALVLTGFGAACSSDAASTPSAGGTPAGGAAAAGASAAGAPAAGAGQGGSGGSATGGASGSAAGGASGSAAGGASGSAAGGASGAGGSSGAAGGGSQLAQDCAAVCMAQAFLDCPSSPNSCPATCAAPGNTSNASLMCQTQYATMIDCEAPLRVSQWTCSQANPTVAIPVDGQCDSTVCSYVCCVGSQVADPDLWSRCQSTCPSK